MWEGVWLLTATNTSKFPKEQSFLAAPCSRSLAWHFPCRLKHAARSRRRESEAKRMVRQVSRASLPGNTLSPLAPIVRAQAAKVTARPPDAGCLVVLPSIERPTPILFHPGGPRSPNPRARHYIHGTIKTGEVLISRARSLFARWPQAPQGWLAARLSRLGAGLSLGCLCRVCM